MSQKRAVGVWVLLAACRAAAEPAPEPPASPAPVAAPTPPPAAAPIAVPGRLVAIGDLHADLTETRAVLREAGIIDEAGGWIAGDTVLVQTGDTTDRGPDGAPILAFFRTLTAEARADGGRVVQLLGNHEVMNLVGDWRYVSEGDLASYGGAARRADALSPTGDDGRWLRGLDATARVGDTVFVHGGIRATFATQGIGAINDGIRAAVADVDRQRAAQPPTPTWAPIRSDAPLLGPDGPLWYRGYVLEPEPTACPELERALTALGARRMVVGHTTRDDGRVEARCGGRLLVIDTGISAHYGTHHSALDIRGQDARVIYPVGTEDLPDPP